MLKQQSALLYYFNKPAHPGLYIFIILGMHFTYHKECFQILGLALAVNLGTLIKIPPNKNKAHDMGTNLIEFRAKTSRECWNGRSNNKGVTSLLSVSSS